MFNKENRMEIFNTALDYLEEEVPGVLLYNGVQWRSTVIPTGKFIGVQVGVLLDENAPKEIVEKVVRSDGSFPSMYLFWDDKKSAFINKSVGVKLIGIR